MRNGFIDHVMDSHCNGRAVVLFVTEMYTIINLDRSRSLDIAIDFRSLGYIKNINNRIIENLDLIYILVLRPRLYNLD